MEKIVSNIGAVHYNKFAENMQFWIAANRFLIG